MTPLSTYNRMFYVLGHDHNESSYFVVVERVQNLKSEFKIVLICLYLTLAVGT